VTDCRLRPAKAVGSIRVRSCPPTVVAKVKERAVPFQARFVKVAPLRASVKSSSISADHIGMPLSRP
jgi:hypothetical protein